MTSHLERERKRDVKTLNLYASQTDTGALATERCMSCHVTSRGVRRSTPIRIFGFNVDYFNGHIWLFWAAEIVVWAVVNFILGSSKMPERWIKTKPVSFANENVPVGFLLMIAYDGLSMCARR